MNNKPLPPFTSLAGQILIAMPNQGDDRFDRTVVYICTHTEDGGAMGIVVNRPAEKLPMKEVLTQLKLPLNDNMLERSVFLGGPAQTTRGFILHSDDYMVDASSVIADGIVLTATQDVLRDIAENRGPRDYLVALGCATWVRGQLEEEIMTNVWLTAHPTYDLIFKTSYLTQWEKSLALLNIRPELLSADAGKA